MITNPVKGMRVKVIANSTDHEYTVGQTYTIKRIAYSQGCCRLADSKGRTLNWCCFADLASNRQVGWDWLSANLPSETLKILSAFDGLDGLTLKEEIANALVSEITDLRQRILDVTESQSDPEPATDAEDDHGPDVDRLKLIRSLDADMDEIMNEMFDSDSDSESGTP